MVHPSAPRKLYPGPRVNLHSNCGIAKSTGRYFRTSAALNAGDAAPPAITGALLTLFASYGNSDLAMGIYTSAAPRSRSGVDRGKWPATAMRQASQRHVSDAVSGTTHGRLVVRRARHPSHTFRDRVTAVKCGGSMPPFLRADLAIGRIVLRPARPCSMPSASSHHLLARGPTLKARIVRVVAELQQRLTNKRNGGTANCCMEYYANVPPWRGGCGPGAAACRFVPEQYTRKSG